MGILSIVLLVFFVIVAALLVLLVLIQNEEGDSLGGIFAGGSSSAFGSRSGNVLTRATTVLGALFLIISLGLALLNRTPGGMGVVEEGRKQATEAGGTNWVDEELNPAGEVAPEATPLTAPEGDAPLSTDPALINQSGDIPDADGGIAPAAAPETAPLAAPEAQDSAAE